jgi:hypothetical protein
MRFIPFADHRHFGNSAVFCKSDARPMDILDLLKREAERTRLAYRTEGFLGRADASGSASITVGKRCLGAGDEFQ